MMVLVNISSKIYNNYIEFNFEQSKNTVVLSEHFDPTILI